MNNLVSVLVSAYNAEKYIEECIRAIMLQSYNNIEVIVVNDGSTDNTQEILNRLSHEYARGRELLVLQNETNLGLIKSLNKGLTYCNGKYVARTDADDIVEPFWIETIVEKMEREPDLLAVGGFITILHDNDVPLGKVGKYTKNKDVWKGCLEYEEILREFPFKNQFTHPTMVIRNDVFKKYNLFYDEKYPHAEDYKLWLEILKRGKMANIPQSFTYYRVHHNQISSKYNDIQEKSARKIRIEATNFLLQKLGINYSFHENYYFNDLSDFAEFISSKKNILPASDFKSLNVVLFNMILNLIYQNCGSIEFLLYILKYKHLNLLQKRKILSKTLKSLIRRNK